jgi:hypothetical protein
MGIHQVSQEKMVFFNFNLNFNLKFKIFINFCRHFMHGNALWGWGDVSLNKWPLALALVYFLNDSL